LQLIVYIAVPLVWDRYHHIRTNIELFILNKKTEKDRAHFAEVIELLPVAVMVVGKPTKEHYQPV